MARERIEDLGRISELLVQVIASPVFSEYDLHDERFIELMNDHDNREGLCYAIHALRAEICDILEIARWGDDED